MIDKKKDRNELEQLVMDYGIKILIHFTRIENVPAILRYGLLSRRELETRKISAVTNDLYRYDYQPNTVCLSIEFPNYKMFYQLRNKDLSKKWVVIGLNASVLWEKECIFCTENASNRGISQISIQERKGADALRRLFIEDKRSRAAFRNYPNESAGGSAGRRNNREEVHSGDSR